MCRSSSDANARQIAFDELQDAAPGLEADLDEDAGRPLMLSRAAWTSRGTCRSFETTRRRVRPPARTRRAPAGQARPEDVGVDLRVAVPGPDRLELVHPRFDVRRRRSGARPARPGRATRIDLVQAAAESGQRADVGVDRRPAQVLEQVVVEWTPSRLAWLGRRLADTRGSRRRSGEMAPMGTCPVIVGAR